MRTVHIIHNYLSLDYIYDVFVSGIFILSSDSLIVYINLYVRHINF